MTAALANIEKSDSFGFVSRRKTRGRIGVIGWGTF
jgi:hypothetical protein